MIADPYHSVNASLGLQCSISDISATEKEIAVALPQICYLLCLGANATLRAVYGSYRILGYSLQQELRVIGGLTRRQSYRQELTKIAGGCNCGE